MIAMCGVQVKHRKRANDLMLGLNETIDQMAMASSVNPYGDVLRRKKGHVSRKASHFKIEGQRKKGRQMGTC